MSVASNSTIPPIASRRPRRSLLIAGGIAASFTALAIYLQLDATAIGETIPFFDGAVINVGTVFSCGIAAFSLYVWFCWFSGFSFQARRIGFIIPLLLPIIGVATFRYEGVDGYMKPTFVPRWRRAHEAALAGKPVAAKAPQPAGAEKEGTAAAVPAVPTVDLRTETANDFPQFLGPQRTNYLPDAKLADDWNDSPPKEIWRRDIGPGWSGFACRNGFAVTLEQRGSDEWVTCYSLADGELMWHHSAPGRHEETIGGLGPRSTPVIDGGLVFAQGATGLVRCIDGATGKLVWQDDLLERYGLSQSLSEAAVKWGRAGSPLIVGDLLIVPAGGKGSNVRTLIAYHKRTGEVAWEAGNDQVSYASPVLATLGGEEQILYVSEKKVAGYDVTSGKELWQHDWPSHSNVDANCSQSIRLPGDRVLVSKSYGTGGALLQIKCEEGSCSAEPIWESRRVLKTKFTNAVVIDGFAYALSDGILECVDLETGKQKWRGGRYGHGQMLGAGDKLLVLGEDGELMLVAADPKKFRELGKIEALPGITWNNLCLAGNRLLIRNGKQVACYDVP
ncbi:PQQ-binding-like beta-propeller repeat protein [Anatilimnocola floriformis]|uniref:PQQ-binding-like beta-propeller repeat protein n=1 Tax=Anatilimnocola floriformis TaxID=2948575 RepID=UPI0020C1EA19|nr:PQQ-binding-like beta-propeller repeat protein [Anatilimnocola floriformis]